MKRALRRRSNHERGNALLVALIALTGLITLAGLTVMSVQGGIATSGAERFNSIALYAAESGASAAMDTLRKELSCSGFCTFPDKFISSSNVSPPKPSEIPGNQKQPGDPQNLFKMNAWYEVEILNNRSDPGFAALPQGHDLDGDVIIRSTGHGPDGATAQVEWEINGNRATAASTPCPAYAQKDMAENGTGANDCLAAVSAATTATYRPGGP